MVDLGQLREVLEIHEVIRGYDEQLGVDDKVNNKLYRLRCKKSYVSAKEYTDSDRETTKEVLKFIVHSRRDITLDHIVIYKNKEYDIKFVKPSLEGFIEITCERII